MRWPWSRRAKSPVIEFQVHRGDGMPVFGMPVAFSAHVGSLGHLKIVVEGGPDVVVDFEVKDGWP